MNTATNNHLNMARLRKMIKEKDKRILELEKENKDIQERSNEKLAELTPKKKDGKNKSNY